MIDPKYKVRRYISEFSNTSDKLLSEYDLSDFNLSEFQKEFGESDLKNPMYASYPIRQSNVAFLKNYINKEPNWDFNEKSYFVESHAI